VLSPEILVTGVPLVEFSSSSEFLRLVAARTRSPLHPPERGQRSRERGPPLLSFLLQEHIYDGCPCRHGLASRLVRGRRGLPASRRCRPQGWFPLDGSGCERGGANPERPVLFHVAPTLRGLVSCRSRPWSASLQSFPLSRSRARSREPRLLPCGFAFDDRRRGPGEPFTPLSPPRRPFATVDPEVTGRMGQDDGFPRRQIGSVVRA